MELVLKNLKYHREKDKATPINEPQACLLVSELINAALNNAGFTCDIEAKE